MLKRLADFLRARGLTEHALSARRIGDGHSNLTFIVSDGERQVVVRRPPPPPVPLGAHDVMREARVIQALSETDVPVPKVLATAKAGEVIDAQFYVMSLIPGVVFTDRTPEGLATPRVRADISTTYIDTLAKLHAVDWRAVGLQDFGRPQGFNRRHFLRICALLTSVQSDLPSGFARMRAWLEAHVPAETDASIIHNDYRLGNLMWAERVPVRLLAILDWELATLGDPLLDVAYALTSWPVAGVALTPTQVLGRALLEPGYASREELIARYTMRTRRSLVNLRWYMAFVDWKLATLYEYSRRRQEDNYFRDPALVESFLEAALRSADQRR